MSFQKLDQDTFETNVFSMMSKEWFLLTAGTVDHCNTMTCAWGSLGHLWISDIATVYVRESRYTHEFMEQYDTFSMSFFGDSHRDALNLCGSKSGRDLDKIEASGLTKIQIDNTVAFEQAKLIVTCKKIYRHHFEPERFDPRVKKIYEGVSDYHTMYIGEVLGVYRSEE